MSHHPVLAARVRSQRVNQPELYGSFDFDALPHRFTAEPGVHSALPGWVAPREEFIDDEVTLDLVATATMLGDVVADPYAALAPRFGMRGLVTMLQQACREGVDAVDDAPDELRDLIAAMEATPQWLDLDLVEQGAKSTRVPTAFLSPFIIRGVFLGTFTNTYAALPMTMTGALSSNRARHRVLETASFFTGTTLPHALDRFGWGFEAAAMVRLMHSTVRVNALQRPGAWDAEVFGMPVPQIDQMPAGMVNVYLLALDVLKQGREEFNDVERAVVEFTRYRCFLLGLPEELLPTHPAGVVRIFHARGATLRADFDDAVCGELMRSTMAAHLPAGHSLYERMSGAVEKSWSKVAFAKAFCKGDRADAARMGVDVSRADQVRVSVTAPFVLGRLALATRASRSPLLAGLTDRYAMSVLRRRLRSFGVPEFTTDARHYPAAHAA